MRAGGFRISDGFISPLDLVGIGLMTAEEAQEHHEMAHGRSADAKKKSAATAKGR